ncbi:hypothetical protein EJB05_24536, partial [Eragrostis curvula]
MAALRDAGARGGGCVACGVRRHGSRGPGCAARRGDELKGMSTAVINVENRVQAVATRSFCGDRWLWAIELHNACSACEKKVHLKLWEWTT